MCLAVPMKVFSVSREFAVVGLSGVKRQVNIQMLPHLRAGDYVIVHAGFAIQKVDEEEARKSLEFLK